MKDAFSGLRDRLRRVPPFLVRTLAVVLLLGIAWGTSDLWGPGVRAWLSPPEDAHAEEDPHHDADHADSIRISEQGKRNLGLRVGTVEVRSYSRKITVPSIVVGLPGRTRFQIAAPLTGIITEIAIVRGQSIWSDELLFRMRLSQEDLVRAQTEYLRTLGELAAENKEIVRLQKVAGRGVAAQILLQHEYTRDKLTAVMKAQEEALRLHGLSTEQVSAIKTTKSLTRQLVIRVPRLHTDLSLHFERDRDGHDHPTTGTAETGKGAPGTAHAVKRHRFVVEQLPVHVGESVNAGDTLCVLADYRDLFIEGWGFEQDAPGLVRAANEDRTIVAVPEGNGEADRKTVSGLKIVYVNNEIDPRSRALHFYVGLPNELSRSVQRGGRTFLTWEFRPGQRMQVRIPVETWKDVIVLPVDAVAEDGAEFYVFVENGKAFVKRPVAVKYRDQFEVVLDYDGSVSPGDRVALNGAHQLLMALKKQAGGGAGGHGHGHSHMH